MSREVSPYKDVQRMRPPMSTFNLSYSKDFTCDMGQLIPVMADMVLPGDIWRIGNHSLVRMMPAIAPFTTEVNIYAHSFFVPLRLLWDEFEEFITRGKDGDATPAVPQWIPTKSDIGSLWDYLGFQPEVDPDGIYPVDFPRRAYNLIYNEYYIDRNLMDDVPLDNEDILYRLWEKDYFTSALPFQQRGTAPSLPVAGHAPLQMKYLGGQYPDYTTVWGNTGIEQISGSKWSPVGDDQGPSGEPPDYNSPFYADLSGATTFSMTDLRYAHLIQLFQEHSAMFGSRYTEHLRGFFGVAPTDARLQRPEYIGGRKVPLIVSEVLQTSETDTSPQGNMAGHGIMGDQTYIGSYRALEHGIIMTLLSIMPRSLYGQGIDRQWIIDSSYDVYNPLFAHLSEMPIYKGEVFAEDINNPNAAQANREIFGFTSAWNWHRRKRSIVCGKMQPSPSSGDTNLSFWNMARFFDFQPSLNDEFLYCKPDKRVFAVPTEDSFIVSYHNILKTTRPLPPLSTPRLV